MQKYFHCALRQRSCVGFSIWGMEATTVPSSWMVCLALWDTASYWVHRGVITCSISLLSGLVFFWFYLGSFVFFCFLSFTSSLILVLRSRKKLLLSLRVAVPYPRRNNVFPSEGRVPLHEGHTCTRKYHMRIELCVELDVLWLFHDGHV